ncbi:MAG: sensor histidine kinase [Deltaproteobacteria bacterium]|nr:sensor histidine kinase [Deltaproteobacteria bacterium]
MRLAQFITERSEQIIAEWEVFARSCTPAASAMDLTQRRDHAAGMLQAIALDLETPQTKQAQAAKSKGTTDADVDSATAANSHGTERAATGYTPVQMVSEFRALRASIQRMWSESQTEFTRASFEDVTRFNEAIDQNLAESLARYAMDVERSKDLFLGVLGHDLRNPLGAIMMSATVMMTQEGPEWVHSKTASRILNSGTRMNEMIGDLLDFTRSRLGAGIPLVREDMDLDTTCRHVVDEIAAFHPRFTVNVQTSGQLRGRWDSGRIAQVLSNLVGNAYQHGAPDQPVQVAVRGEPDEVVLSVTNQGAGIAKQHLKDIFNPFRQLDAGHTSSSDATSLGLGLYIAQAIVLAHAGTIEVESTTRGTTFTVRLPRRVPVVEAGTLDASTIH